MLGDGKVFEKEAWRRGKTRLVTIGGQRMTLREAAALRGMTYAAFQKWCWREKRKEAAAVAQSAAIEARRARDERARLAAEGPTDLPPLDAYTDQA